MTDTNKGRKASEEATPAAFALIIGEDTKRVAAVGADCERLTAAAASLIPLEVNDAGVQGLSASPCGHVSSMGHGGGRVK